MHAIFYLINLEHWDTAVLQSKKDTDKLKGVQKRITNMLSVLENKSSKEHLQLLCMISQHKGKVRGVIKAVFRWLNCLLEKRVNLKGSTRTNDMKLQGNRVRLDRCFSTSFLSLGNFFGLHLPEFPSQHFHSS